MIADLLNAYWAWAAVGILVPFGWIAVWEHFKNLTNDS